ncbi:unnamed protein product [Gordionus sp. m RMFG-2023]
MSMRGFIAMKYPIFYKVEFDGGSNLDSFIIFLLTVISLITSLPFLFDKTFYLSDHYSPMSKYLIKMNERVRNFFGVYYSISMMTAITLPCILMLIFTLQIWYLMYRRSKLITKVNPVATSAFILDTATNNSPIPMSNNSNNSRLNSRAINLHNFVVVVTSLSTTTFVLSIPVTILIFTGSKYMTFDKGCDFDELFYLFIILKHFIYPYLILFASPVLRRLTFKKIQEYGARIIGFLRRL